MRWSWIVLLSASGALMGALSLYGVAHGLEAVLWLAIWIGCALALAFAVSGKAFVNGLATGALAAVLYSVVLYAGFDTYLAHNPALLEGPKPTTGADLRSFQLVLMPLVALFSGLFLGLLTLMVWKVRYSIRERRQERSA
jgi:hypothetical protein